MKQTNQLRIVQNMEAEPIRGCWLWTGYILPDGYGQFAPTGEHWQRAHRASYKAFHGPIPDDLHVLHRCDIKRCVNPLHLYLGTNRDNFNDRVRDGKQHYKITPEERISIGRSTLTTAELAAAYSIHPEYVRRLKRRYKNPSAK